MNSDRTKPRTVAGEARRGAHDAREFLGKGPSQATIWRVIQASKDEERSGPGEPGDLAYEAAFQAVLIPNIIDAEATRQEVEQADAEALERALAELNKYPLCLSLGGRRYPIPWASIRSRSVAPDL